MNETPSTQNCARCGAATATTRRYCEVCATELVNSSMQQAHDDYQSFEYRRALRGCEQALKLDPLHTEATHLKNSILERIKSIEVNTQRAKECFEQHMYDLVVFHLTAVLRLDPRNEDARKQRDMARLLSKVEGDPEAEGEDAAADADAEPVPAQQQVQDWARQNIPTWQGFIVLGLVVVALGVFASDWYYRSSIQRQEAKDLYASLRQKVALEEYQTSSFMEEYEKLAGDFGDSAVARRAQAELGEIYQQVKAQQDEKFQELWKRGQLLQQQNAYLEAVEIWEELLAVDPDNQLVKTALQRAKDQLLWEKSIGAPSGSTERYRNMLKQAAASERDGRWQQALARYQQALGMATDNEDARAGVTRMEQRMATVLASRKSVPSQAPDDDVVTEEPVEPDEVTPPVTQSPPTRVVGDVRTLLLNGQRQLAAQQYEKAIATWEHVIEIDPKQAHALVPIIANARELLERQRERYADLMVRAQQLEAQQKWEAALDTYHKVMQVKPGDPVADARIKDLEANFKRAEQASLFGQLHGAVRVWRREVLTFFKSWQHGLGVMHQQVTVELRELIGPQFSQVIDRWQERRAARRTIRRVRWLERALEEDGQDELRAANRWYQKLQRDQPDEEIAERILVNNLIVDTERRIERGNSDAMPRITLGSAYYVKGQHRRAIDAWAPLRSIHANDSVVMILTHGLLGSAWEAEGELGLAKEALLTALEYGDLLYVRSDLANILWQLGERDAAKNVWKQILENHPHQLDVLVDAARAAWEEGDQNAAIRLLTSFSDLTPIELRLAQLYPSAVDPRSFVQPLSVEDQFAASVYRLAQTYALFHWNSRAEFWVGAYLELRPLDDNELDQLITDPYLSHLSSVQALAPEPSSSEVSGQ